MNYAVILAGGKGLRLGSDIPKQLLPLGGKPVLKWAVEAFHKTEEIDHLIVVSERNSIGKIREILPENSFPKIIEFIEGGIERSDSSYNALNCRSFRDEDIFLFHDAARPFVTGKIISDTINEIKSSGAAGVYIPAVDTIAVTDHGEVRSIPDRKNVYYAQTPQGFRYRIIKDAHDLYRSGSIEMMVTDDVSLVMASGHKVSVVNGSVSNFKITTELDYRIARFMVESGLII